MASNTYNCGHSGVPMVDKDNTPLFPRYRSAHGQTPPPQIPDSTPTLRCQAHTNPISWKLVMDLPADDILHHVVDVHCHPTDAPHISPQSMDQLRITVCAMATRSSDQPLVRDLATAYPSKVVPCFGYHPWFSYSITTDPALSKEEHYKRLFLNSQKTIKIEYQEAFNTLLAHLPTPRSLSEVLHELRQNLNSFPNAMVGEVGLDRAFHVPYDFDTTPRKLTPFTVPLDHQLAILEAQMDLAVELGRNLSIHSVKSQQATVDLLAKLEKKHGDSWYRISVDMHSCGFSLETWRILEKKYSNVFLSLSTVINEKHSGYKTLIAACSDDRILAESDFNDIRMTTMQTWDMLQKIAEIKQWQTETVWTDSLDERNWGTVRRLERNWIKFRDGNHPPPSSISS